LFVFFFFFQAEDGIRDRNVTGVQTCALPISGALARQLRLPRRSCRARAPGTRRCHPPRETSRRTPRAPARREPECQTRRRVDDQIGRASCRERVWGSEGGGALKKKGSAAGRE